LKHFKKGKKLESTLSQKQQSLCWDTLRAYLKDAEVSSTEYLEGDHRNVYEKISACNDLCGDDKELSSRIFTVARMGLSDTDEQLLAVLWERRDLFSAHDLTDFIWNASGSVKERYILHFINYVIETGMGG
jgi:hypothetical protein